MHISARELRHMVEQVDDQHRDGMRTFREEIEEVTYGETGQMLGHNRRQFLTRAAVGGAVLTIGSTVLPFSRILPVAAQELDDAAIAQFAASVELAAVALYELAASSGLVTTPAVGEAATLFGSHHQEHADGFNALASTPAEGPNQALLDALQPQIDALADEAGVLELAFEVEQSAASTYVFALGALAVPEAYAATAQILPIEAQHAVVLATVLGKSPAEYLPPFESVEATEGTAAALDPTQFPVG